MPQLSPAATAGSNGSATAQASEPLNEQDLAEIRGLMVRIRRELHEALAELVRSRREAREHCQVASEMVAKQHALVEELLEPPQVIGYLDRLRFNPAGHPRAVVAINGQRRELAIHPDVDHA